MRGVWSNVWSKSRVTAPACGLVLVTFALSSVCPAAEHKTTLSANQDGPGRDLFAGTNIPVFTIEIDKTNLELLRRQPRTWARAIFGFGAKTYANVGIHVKGSRGSWQSIDERPSLTLRFDRFIPGQRFQGLDKIHLNNAVEDPSFLNEYLGSHLFQSAGVPNPRAGHAFVRLKDQPRQLYVLKEGFTEDFLARHFESGTGNLYEPEPGPDVCDRLDRKQGIGPDEQSDLRRLTAAARQADGRRRWAELCRVLQVDRFLSFMAMEVMVGHRDGYCLARNNYRVYHDPGNGFVFLPHGMDRLFGNPEAAWLPEMSGLVARSIMETTEGQRRYRERFASLLTNVLQVDRLIELINDRAALIQPRLQAAEARVFERDVELLRERILRRRTQLGQQLDQPQKTRSKFVNDALLLSGWYPVDEPRGGALRQANSPDGRPALHIKAGPLTGASWRTRVVLPSGRYRFEGRVCCANVRSLKHGRNQGVGLRVGGARTSRPYELTGNANWTPQAVEFDVKMAEQEVELMCELRAQAGEAWYERDSLRIVRLTNR